MTFAEWRPRTAALLISATFFFTGAVNRATADEVEVELAAKIILKILVLDTELEEKTNGEIRVGVIGSHEAIRAFESLEGEPIDKAKAFRISQVVGFDRMPPDKKPTMIFVGADADPEAVTQYTRANGVLSVTNVPKFVERGVTLGIGIENSRPKVILNLTGSESEGLNWDAKILKISKTIR